MPIRTAVVALPCAGTSTVYCILDALASTGRDWQMLHGGPPKPPVFDLELLSVDGSRYQDPNGRVISPDGSIKTSSHPDLIIVPHLHIDPMQRLPEDLMQLVPWIVQAHSNGAIVASVCSGAMLLAVAGLLDGHEATSHWGVCDVIASQFPEIRMRRERVLVPTGEGHRIVTAGGGSAWGDLVLYLVGRFANQEEARRLAKVYLLQPHSEGQLQYASLVAGAQCEDKLIANAQVWASDNYASPTPVAAMAAHFGLNERSLLRRFRKATGQTPVGYIQTLRVEEAKQMLETTDTPIEDIATEVGYLETSSFRTSFRRLVGISASAYRKKWLPGKARADNDSTIRESTDKLRTKNSNSLQKATNSDFGKSVR